MMKKPPVHGGGGTTTNSSRRDWNSPSTSNSNATTRGFVPLQHVRVDRTKPSPSSSVSVGGPLSQSSLLLPSPPPAAAGTEATTKPSTTLPLLKPATSSSRTSQRELFRSSQSSRTHAAGPRRNNARQLRNSEESDSDDDDDNDRLVARKPNAPLRRPTAGSLPQKQPSLMPTAAPLPSEAAATRIIPVRAVKVDSRKGGDLLLSSSDEEGNDDNNRTATGALSSSFGTSVAAGGRRGGQEQRSVARTTKNNTGGANGSHHARRNDASSDDDDGDSDEPSLRKKPGPVGESSTSNSDKNRASAASIAALASRSNDAEEDTSDDRGFPPRERRRKRASRDGRRSNDSSDDDDDGGFPTTSHRRHKPSPRDNAASPISDDDRKPAAKGVVKNPSVLPSRNGAVRGRRSEEESDEISESPEDSGNNEPPPPSEPPVPSPLPRDENGRLPADEVPPPERSDTSPAVLDPRQRAKIQDALWDDGSDDDDDQPSGNASRANHSRTKKNVATHPSTTNRDSLSSTAPSRGDREVSGMQQNQDGVDDIDEDDSDEDGYDAAFARHELHPHFNDPAYGPFEEEPLLLGESAGVSFQVPRSINRYLYDFQKEGVKFMFNMCIKSKGSILGDDMGLGKTIQVIALLAALLEKTGTKRDWLELRRRERLVKARLRGITSDQRKALQDGTTFQLPDVASEVGLPKWCPILIVVPVTVTNSWVKALEEWGYFGIGELNGEKEKKQVKNGGETELERVRSGKSEILICKQSLFRNPHYLQQLVTIQWKLVVCDEFHLFKSSTKQLSTNLRKLRAEVPGLVVIGLTGTLMQNEHKEAWNQIDLVQPNLLGDMKHFQLSVADPIKHGMKKGASREEKERGENISELFKAKTLPQVYLRRTKLEVLGEYLPSKDEIVVFCELSKTQKEIYSYILKQPDFVLLSHANGPCDCSVNSDVFRQYKRLTTQAERLEFVRRNKDKITRRCECCYRCPWNESLDGIAKNAVLWRQLHGDSLCERCRQTHDDCLCERSPRQPRDFGRCRRCPWCVCFPAIAILGRLVSHVSLLQAENDPETFTAGTAKHDEATQALEKAKAFLPPHLVKEGKIAGGYICPSALDFGDHTEMSGKLAVLSRLLQRIRREHGRVLLFSTSTMILSVIETFLTFHHTDLECRRMDGTTPRDTRDKLVQEFKSNPKINVFLLSTKAMGLGLNLTEANNVIIFDVEWNPSWDEQAQDRAYRIGQKKDVRVYRLVARGTVEELKYLRQIYKKQLNDQTFSSGDDRLSDQQKKQFRGVAKDKENKGELFGMANLLKFRDGTFMKYQSSSSSTRRRKGDVDQVVADDILATVQGMTEDDVMGIGDDDQVTAWDALTRERGKEEPNYDSDSDAYFEDCGAESQVNIGIMNRAELACDAPEAGQSIASPAAVAAPPSLPLPDRVESWTARGGHLSVDRASSAHSFAGIVGAETQPGAPEANDTSHIHIHLPTKSKTKGTRPKKRKVETR